MFTAFFVTYGAVFVAEIVGDKLFYTTGILATRYRTLPIFLGMAAAFMVKMGVAVLVGEAITRLPVWLVAVLSGISFGGLAERMTLVQSRTSHVQHLRMRLDPLKPADFGHWTLDGRDLRLLKNKVGR